MSQPITPKPLVPSSQLSRAILRRLSSLERDAGFDVISDVPRRTERTEQQDEAAREPAE